MNETISQPDAAPVPEALIESLVPLVAPEADCDGGPCVEWHDTHSNDLAELRFRDGRTLMVKRGRYPWAAERFETSRVAASLVRQREAAIVPEPLPLPGDLDERPVEAYWRIQLPTLQEVWPELSAPGRAAALESCGRLLRRLHEIRLRGHGPLGPARQGMLDLSAHLSAELGERLLPAIYDIWPDAAQPVEVLLAAVPAVVERRGSEPAALVHGDVHAGNVLCDARGERVECVGLLDLETASAGPPETDLAVAQVHHGPLFTQPLPDGWERPFLRGYGRALDPFVLGFYRAYHLANMGFYSALVGHREHAAAVGAALDWEVERLRCES